MGASGAKQAGGLFVDGMSSPPSSLCSSQGSSRRASARREGASPSLALPNLKRVCRAADAALLDSCDKHRNEGELGAAGCLKRDPHPTNQTGLHVMPFRLALAMQSLLFT